MADDAASIVRDADTCVSQRNFNRAQALYERAQAEGVRFDTDLPHASNLAAVYLNSTPPDLPNAIKWLQAAVTLAPQSDSLRLQLASSLYRSGNYEAAIDQYKFLAEAHPTSAEYGIQLATVLRQAGKADVALQFLQASTEKYPNLVAFRIEYARQLNFSKQFGEARKQFSAALSIAPQSLIAQVGLAKATSYEGDQETAIEMYDRILQRHPGSYDAIVGKAFSLLWSGRTEQAGVLLRQASVRNPGDNEVREALSTLPHSAGVPAAMPEDRIRRLGNPRRATLRHPLNTEMPGSNPTLSDRTIPSQPEHPLRPDDQQQGQGVAIAMIGFFCLLLAPIVYGRSRAHRLKSRAGETDALCRAERNSGRFPRMVEPMPAAGAFTENSEGNNIQPATSTGKCTADARQPSVEASIAYKPLPVPVLAEEPARDTAGQRAHEPLQPSAPHSFVAPDESEPETKLKVLLVGGRLHEVELESRWFPIAAAVILWERNWAAALRCLEMAPPDLLVLNTLTDDGRTSQQMFAWIVTNRAEFRERTIAIRTASGGLEQKFSDADLVEPFGAQQWRQAVLSTVHSGEATSCSDKPAEPLPRSSGDKLEPQERTYSELRTLLCSATSFGPLVEANPVPPAGSYSAELGGVGV
jgi:tetratricopeptide (TPR) repeat protein